jgi:hypothetical protein
MTEIDYLNDYKKDVIKTSAQYGNCAGKARQFPELGVISKGLDNRRDFRTFMNNLNLFLISFGPSDGESPLESISFHIKGPEAT